MSLDTHFGQGNPSLEHAILRSVHTGDAHVQQGPELARVEMLPDPLLRMVPAGQRALEFGTRPSHRRLILDPDIHLPGNDAQFHLVDRPGMLESEDLPIEFSIHTKQI